jgi:hypothetical protein
MSPVWTPYGKLADFDAAISGAAARKTETPSELVALKKVVARTPERRRFGANHRTISGAARFEHDIRAACAQQPEIAAPVRPAAANCRYRSVGARCSARVDSGPVDLDFPSSTPTLGA